MSEPVWYRSLYWRVALGLVAFLALMLAAQAALFIWTTDRIAQSMPVRNPEQLAAIIASDISIARANAPALDVQQHVNEHFANVYQTFLVVMRDGSTASNRDDPPAELLAVLRTELERRAQFAERRFGGRSEASSPRRGGGFAPWPRAGVGPLQPDDRFRMVRRDGPRGNVAPIVSGGTIAGLVAVLPERLPLSLIARELGPTLAVVGGAILGVGVVAIALVVFGPVRRRLRLVQEATERLGQGDLRARVPEGGGDEVAALARSFNLMARDLDARATALAASDQARRQLLADVSHELMTPLTAMRGYLETLAMAELQLDPPTRERYLRIVDEETRRLERLIGDLLDLARLEGGGSNMRRESVDTRALFNRVALRHERELADRGVRLVTRVDPAAEQIAGDPDRLEQALQNLAANALRHTPAGGEIALAAEPAPEATRISVRDTGPGIPPEHLPLIFDRFYKADVSRAGAGSGLGLSIVKAIVERHGGTITVRNDRGAVFEILLPAADRRSGTRHTSLISSHEPPPAS